MEQLDAIIQTISLTMGTAWASGINLYATLLVLGIGQMTNSLSLPPDLQILADPLVIGAAGLMYAVEFFADKMPGVDTGWDSIHTFIRIPAGALLAFGMVGDVNPRGGSSRSYCRRRHGRRQPRNKGGNPGYHQCIPGTHYQLDGIHQ